MAVSGCFLIVIIITMSIEGCQTLQCYQCVNLHIKDDTSSFVKTVVGGTDSNPNCGSSPSTSNAVTCQSGMICGAITGDISGDIALVGKLHAEVQIRSCIEGTAGVLGSCKTADSNLLGAVNNVLGALSKTAVISNLKIDGKVCACGTDLCVPDMCNGGVTIVGVCVYNWIIGVSAAALAVIVILLITSCCCCCGCCRKSPPHQGFVLSPVVPTTTMSINQAQNQYPAPYNPNATVGYSNLYTNLSTDPGYNYNQQDDKVQGYSTQTANQGDNGYNNGGFDNVATYNYN